MKKLYILSQPNTFSVCLFFVSFVVVVSVCLFVFLMVAKRLLLRLYLEENLCWSSLD